MKTRDRRRENHTAPGTPGSVVDALESERRRFAAELHDRTGANLAAIKLNLASIAAALVPVTQDEQLLIGETDELLADTMLSIRELCSELRPSLLEYAGLERGIAQVAGQFARRTGIAVELDFEQYTERLPADIELTFLRIAQEALRNCAKHSDAFNVELRFSRRGPNTVLHIVDDGRGFDPSRLGDQGTEPGIGILNMRQRAAAVGATLELTSVPGSGTSIVVMLADGDLR